MWDNNLTLFRAWRVIWSTHKLDLTWVNMTNCLEKPLGLHFMSKTHNWSNTNFFCVISCFKRKPGSFDEILRTVVFNHEVSRSPTKPWQKNREHFLGRDLIGQIWIREEKSVLTDSWCGAQTHRHIHNKHTQASSESRHNLAHLFPSLHYINSTALRAKVLQR